MKLVRQLLEQWLPGAVCAQMSRTEVAVLWPGEEEKLEEGLARLDDAVDNFLGVKFLRKKRRLRRSRASGKLTGSCCIRKHKPGRRIP
ncbi:MAG: hypothetical protein ACLVLH_12730 [Eisenbergiella massiliensis]